MWDRECGSACDRYLNNIRDMICGVRIPNKNINCSCERAREKQKKRRKVPRRQEDMYVYMYKLTV